jgi:hypothetical protein
MQSSAAPGRWGDDEACETVLAARCRLQRFVRRRLLVAAMQLLDGDSQQFLRLLQVYRLLLGTELHISSRRLIVPLSALAWHS